MKAHELLLKYLSELDQDYTVSLLCGSSVLLKRAALKTQLDEIINILNSQDCVEIRVRQGCGYMFDRVFVDLEEDPNETIVEWEEHGILPPSWESHVWTDWTTF